MSNEKLVLLDNPSVVLEAEDRPVELVDVPEWKSIVRIRGMNVEQRLTFAESMPKKGEEVDFSMLKPHLLSFCIVQKSGAPLFSVKDVKALAQRNVAVIDRLYEVAARLCGMGQAEAIRKN